MGLIRKTMAFGTMGVVSYRSKDERAVKYAKQTRNAARAQVVQNGMMLETQRQMVNGIDHGNVREEVRDMRSLQAPAIAAPAAPPAGFYSDPSGDSTLLRWFDGTQWTDMTKPRD